MYDHFILYYGDYIPLLQEEQRKKKQQEKEERARKRAQAAENEDGETDLSPEDEDGDLDDLEKIKFAVRNDLYSICRRVGIGK